MKKYYVESRHDLDLIRHATRYMVLPNFDQEFSETLQSVKRYLKASRQGEYDYLNNYPCGYQDSFGDKVDALFFKYNAMKISYKLKRGDATQLKQVVDRMVGASHDL